MTAIDDDNDEATATTAAARLALTALEATVPKMKTHKGMKKRFRVTRNGKVMRHNAMCNHILTKKTADRKRRLRRASKVAETGVAKRIKRALGR